jgi:hypothetical protein
MSKKLIVILTLAFVVGVTAAAFAEVQNVKVGGDLTEIGFTRSNLNLQSGSNNGSKQASGIASIARIKIDANLTDNVDVTFRLLNERSWSSTSESYPNATAVDVDLAYVTFKEFMKSTIQVPVNLMVGRQDIKIGSGLLVGAAGTNQSNTTQLPLGIGDFSTRGAFDGAVGVIDLSPLTITTALVKVTEGSILQGADSNLYVLDGAYNFGKDAMDTMLEVTYAAAQSRKNEVNNLDGRVTIMPIENLGLEAEYAFQTNKQGSLGYWDQHEKNKNAQAIRLAANFAMPEVIWKPAVGVDFTSLSNRWNVMQESITPAGLTNLIFPNTDINCVGAWVSAKPMDDLMLNVRFVNLSLYKKGLSSFTSAGTGDTYAMNSGKKALGNEVDLGLAYDYTKDVQFGLGYGVFMPRNAFTEANRKAASQFLGSMKVSF